MKHKINPDIRYSVDVFDVKLYDTKKNKTTVLSWPEAAVWALIVRGHSIQKTSRLMALIGRMTPGHAKAVVDDAITFFRAEHLLSRE